LKWTFNEFSMSLCSGGDCHAPQGHTARRASVPMEKETTTTATTATIRKDKNRIITKSRSSPIKTSRSVEKIENRTSDTTVPIAIDRESEREREGHR